MKPFQRKKYPPMNLRSYSTGIINGVPTAKSTAFKAIKQSPKTYEAFSSGVSLGLDQFFVFAPSKAELSRVLKKLPVGPWSPKNFQHIAVASAKPVTAKR